MAVPWPNGLPYTVSRGAYAVQSLGLPPVQSPMQSGKTRMRRQYTLRVATLSYGWEFTASDLAAFRAFMRDPTGEGTAEILLPTWIESAQAYQPRVVQIQKGVAGLSEKKIGVQRTLVSCVLDVQNL
jgi:hypothetical protein